MTTTTSNNPGPAQRLQFACAVQELGAGDVHLSDDPDGRWYLTVGGTISGSLMARQIGPMTHHFAESLCEEQNIHPSHGGAYIVKAAPTVDTSDVPGFLILLVAARESLHLLALYAKSARIREQAHKANDAAGFLQGDLAEMVEELNGAALDQVERLDAPAPAELAPDATLPMFHHADKDLAMAADFLRAARVESSRGHWNAAADKLGGLIVSLEEIQKGALWFLDGARRGYFAGTDRGQR